MEMTDLDFFHFYIILCVLALIKCLSEFQKGVKIQ